MLDSYGAKTLKTDPLVHFAGLFYNLTVFQTFEPSFFDQVAIDCKSSSLSSMVIMPNT